MIKILVADDDDGYRFPIASLFEDAGFEVLQASTKEDVIKLASEADIWIIDVRLPSSMMEGILAVQALAERRIISKYPVFFVSVLPKSLANNELDLLTPYSIRYEWIEKPVELEVLFRRVQQALEKKP